MAIPQDQYSTSDPPNITVQNTPSHANRNQDRYVPHFSDSPSSPSTPNGAVKQDSPNGQSSPLPTGGPAEVKKPRGQSRNESGALGAPCLGRSKAQLRLENRVGAQRRDSAGER
ncbi:MAG: hypothetical protein M1829_004805 [Trizodia sp. TS-e1964]|nr:MAG: hypothetical protein M1829_004805 [Trizodia sp. TS-e1964]